MAESRVKCPSCGSYEVPGGSECSVCGGPLRGAVHHLVETSDERTCPHCAETIKAAATICRFCNQPVEADRRPKWKLATPAPTPRNNWGVGSFMILIGSLMLVYFFLAFDTSVAVPGQDGRRVNNLGLMQDRQTGVLVGGVLLVAGLVVRSRAKS